MIQDAATMRTTRRRFRPRAEGLEGRALLTSFSVGGFSETVLAAGIQRPTAMQVAPDGRVFVLEQAGAVRVVKDGALLPDPFLTLDVDDVGERGLLGIAFDPNFAANGHVFVHYTAAGPTLRNRVARVTADGDRAVPGSLATIFESPAITATNHVGGAIHFGADGKLYVALGDNGNGANAQSIDTTFGSLLRINGDGTIPADNPFYSMATGENRAIWAMGLRNPFSFAVQPGTGRIFINDVGAVGWEEINKGFAGANYGWPQSEGPTSLPGVTPPVFAYPHGSTDVTGRSIAGGAFYNPAVASFPAGYVGDYFFADFVNRWVRVLDTTTGVASGFATGLPAGVVDLKVDAGGGLLYLARGSGQAGGVLARVGHEAPGQPGDPTPPIAPPAIVAQPVDVLAPLGGSATFVVQAGGGGVLSYQWRRDGVDIPGAVGPAYTLAGISEADIGARFQAVVANASGAVVSAPARLSGEALPIAGLYRDLLGREPDRDGWNGWIAARAGGLGFDAIASAFLGSPERLGVVIASAYRDLLGRAPEPGAVEGWTAQLASGLSEDDFRDRVLNSAEYRARHGGTDAGVVAGMYRDLLGREASPEEVSGWSSRPAAEAIAGVLLSDEAARREVEGWYRDYLGRVPSAGEVAGHASALARTRDRAAGRLAFLLSREYVNRFA